MNKFIEQLEEMDACSPAIKWIEARDIDTVQEFWKVSDRGDWMMWLLYWEYPGINIPIRTLQNLAIAFAESVAPYAGEHKQICIDCIYAAWQYLDGYINIDELHTAARAVYDVAVYTGANTADVAAAYAVHYAAADVAAAYTAVADTARAAAVANTVRAAAVANTVDNIRIATDNAAFYIGLLKTKKRQADIIRMYIPEV